LSEDVEQRSIPEEKKGNDFMEGGRLLTLDDVEEKYIRKIIKVYSNKNKGELCEILGISRPTFERKLEKYGITLELE
jgi:two-component system response regulator AtoC